MFLSGIQHNEARFPKTSVNIVCGTLAYYQEMDFNIFPKVIEGSIVRFPALRLRMDAENMLCVSDAPPDEIPVIDCRDMTGEQFDSALYAWFNEPFEIPGGALFAFRLFLLPDNRQMSALKLHHYIGDLVSILILIKDIHVVYDMLMRGETPSMEQDMKYLDSMFPPPASPRKERALEMFENINDYVSVPRYMNTADSACVKVDMPRDVYRRTALFCEQSKLRLHDVFHAAVAVCLAGTRSADKIALGAVLNNRRKAQYDIFGMYANTLPLTLDVDPNSSFADLCEQARGEFTKLHLNSSAITLPQIVKASRTADIFDCAVSYRPAAILSDLSFGKWTELHTNGTDLPLRIYANEQEETLSLTLKYSVESYTDSEASELAERIFLVLEGVADGGAQMQIRDILLVGNRDLEAWNTLNSFGTLPSEPINIYQSFCTEAEQNPHGVAVVCGDDTYTFAETQSIVNAIRRHLCSVSFGSVVGLATGRHALLPAAMLGVLSAGCAFLPLDSGNASSAECDIILTPAKLSEIAESALSEPESGSEPLPAVFNTAYLMRTSGSSGTPKTAAISERALAVRLEWMNRKYGLNRRILQKTNTLFDVSVWELLSLAYGGTVVVLPEGYEKQLPRMAEHLIKYDIAAVHFVPSVLALFLRHVKENDLRFPALKHIFSSGEKLSPALAQECRRVIGEAELHNLYGPTECTIDVTYYDCDFEGKVDDIPIGMPVAGTEIYVTDKHGRIMPVGVCGEILVCGELVGLGYTDTGAGGFCTFRGKRAYRTGDNGYLGKDGKIYFVGRSDRQLKIHGIRVDLSGIEAAAAMIEGVKSACCFEYDGHLLLYYAADADADISHELSRRLGVHSVPSVIRRISELPITKNGKTDRAALLAIPLAENKYTPPANEREELLASAVERQLQADNISDTAVSVTDNLFNIGLDSLSIMAVIADVAENGVSVEFSDFYKYKTVRDIAAAQTEKTPAVRLKSAPHSRRAVLCFPYGGGNAESYTLFADGITDSDVFAVNYSYFAPGDTVWDIASFFRDYLCNYDEVEVVGCCIGSGFAIETTRVLEASGKQVSALMLIASLPFAMPFIKNPWRLLGKRGINPVLSYLSRQKIKMQGEQMSQFLIDSDRFFAWSRKKCSIQTKASVHMIFGEGDRFTKGFRHKHRRWFCRVGHDVRISVCETSSHRFIEEIPVRKA